jgi:hypothetical protein
VGTVEAAAGFTTDFSKYLPAVDKAFEVLQYPPRPMPDGACTCRYDMNKSRIPMDCPSPWSNLAGTTMVSTGQHRAA